MTIEERANKHWEEYEYPSGNLYQNVFKDGYRFGATDQRKIDIEKACEYIRQRSYGYSSKTITDKFIKGLQKAMEK